ncbi:MAG: hypothetical protein ABW292_03165 [Vicinamibacterales bacterium]
MALPHRHVLMGVAMAEVPAPARRPLRFSSFELDLQPGELRKAGGLVGLQEQSLKVLVELLARPGDLGGDGYAASNRLRTPQHSVATHPDNDQSNQFRSNTLGSTRVPVSLVATWRTER